MGLAEKIPLLTSKEIKVHTHTHTFKKKKKEKKSVVDISNVRGI